MEVMVAVGEGMENGDVRGIKMVTKEVDEEMGNCYEDMICLLYTSPSPRDRG